MFTYHVRMAIAAILRDRAASLLAILAIGLGIGAATTMATLLREMTRDPLPGRSGELYYPHLDASPAGFAASRPSDFDPGSNLTWTDARNLLDSGEAEAQAVMAGGRVHLAATEAGSPPFAAYGRYATSQFFDLFGVPFLRGAAWTRADDDARGRIVVLDSQLAQRLFGGSDVVGRTVRIEGTSFVVGGIVGTWRPSPLFYGASGGDGAYRGDGFFLPLPTALDLALPFSGSMACWGEGHRDGDGCAWLQFWVRLRTQSARSRYVDFLASYARAQRDHGRHVRMTGTPLLSVRERIRQLRTIPGQMFAQAWLAGAFLLVCLCNVTGLLLARYLARERESGIRRALGATRRQLFAQFAIDAVTLGVAGGAIGVLVAMAGLWLVRQRPDAYAGLAHLDATMLCAAVATSTLAVLAAGLVPAWKACRASPSANLGKP